MYIAAANVYVSHLPVAGSGGGVVLLLLMMMINFPQGVLSKYESPPFCWILHVRVDVRVSC